jgi:fumarylacetoacetate (FAA) hydrolase family protein
MIEYLPSDWRDAVLVGRILTREGPTPVIVARGRVRDVSSHAATVSQLLNAWNGAIPPGQDLGPLEDFGFTREFAGAKDVRLLSPFDLQCIKASGVTFAISAMERVIEERCRGDASKADSLRASLRDRIGADIRSVKPGSEGGGKAQGRPHLGRLVVAVSRGGDRAGRGNLHQGADAVDGRLGGLGRRALRFRLEQSRARDRAGGR